MGRLQLHPRSLGSAALVVLLASACASDEVEIPETLRGEPACAWIIDTRGHFEDGRTRLIIHEHTSGPGTGAACLCLTEEEFETQVRHDELNDRALVVCNELAQQHDFAWDECQMDHDSERWLDFVFWAVGDWARPEADALGCVGE